MTREPIHPGEHLTDELRELGISARELARELKVPVTRVTEILRGRRGITGDTALRLGRYFQVSPDFWMNLQKLYEIDLARRQIGEDLASIMPRASGIDCSFPAARTAAGAPAEGINADFRPDAPARKARGQSSEPGVKSAASRDAGAFLTRSAPAARSCRR